MSNRTSRVTSGTITGLLQTLLNSLFQIFISPSILKYAGQETLGAYSVILQIVGYTLIFDFGFSVAFTRYLAKSTKNGVPKFEFFQILSVGRVIQMILAIVVFVFLLLITWKIDFILPSSTKMLSNIKFSLIIMAIWALLKSPYIIYGQAINATQNMALVNKISIVSNLLKLTLAYFFTYKGYAIVGLIIAFVLSEALLLFMQYYFFNKKKYDFNFSLLKIDLKLAKEILIFGFSYWGVYLSVVFLLGSDLLIAGSIAGATLVSVYYSTKLIGSLAVTFLTRIIDNITPGLSELVGNKDMESVKRTYLKSIRYVLLLLIPACLIIIFYTKILVTLWVGKSQYAGNLMAFLIAVFVFIQVFAHLHGLVSLALGEVKQWSLISIFCGITNLLLCYFIGKNFGIIWIPLGLIISILPLVIFLCRKVLFILNIKFYEIINEIKPLLIVFILVTIITILNYITISYLNLNIFIILAFLIYGILTTIIIFYFGINNEERKLSFVLIKNLINR
jgi:O-antigen/teichoic acid export membrane protein